jgi:hypothetical protein
LDPLYWDAPAILDFRLLVAELRYLGLGTSIPVLDIRITGRQVSKPKSLSPAAHSLDIRIAGRQVPKPRCLSPRPLLGRVARASYPSHGVVSKIIAPELWIHVPSVMTAMAHAMLVMWSMLQSTIDHATERIIAHGPARRTYAYQSPQTRINDYTPTHLTARVHPNLCSPPNPFPQQTRSTNTRNKLMQPVVLFYPTHPTARISTRIRFPPKPNAFGYCSLRPLSPLGPRHSPL